MIELADKLSVIAPPILLVTGIVALVLTLVPRPSRWTVPLVALALVLIGGIWWIVFYAQGLDTYFQDGTTRWDFAAVNRQWAVTAIVVAAVSVVLLLISTFARERDYFVRLSLVGASASSFMLLLGWFVLTVGH
jgi:hypothetical protein